MMPKRTTATILFFWAGAFGLAGPARAQTLGPEAVRKIVQMNKKSAASRPASPSGHRPRRGKLYRILKFTPAKPEQIRANHKLAHAWAGQTRKTITRELYHVPTAHFMIFTTWPKRDHPALAARVESTYRALCRQFNIPASRNVWAGKCPIYIFREKKHYDAFTTKIDKIGAVGAGGYNVQRRDGFTYIVVGQVKTKEWFYEVLVHESTHAFLGRYLTNRVLPRWLNEGLADYMAARLVKGSRAAQKYQPAAYLAVARGFDVSYIFRTVRPSSFDYGIAQSLVRYLAGRDRKGFIQFIRLMKEGKSEVQALKEGMKLTHAEVLTGWRQAVVKKYTRPPRRGR